MALAHRSDFDHHGHDRCRSHAHRFHVDPGTGRRREILPLAIASTDHLRHDHQRSDRSPGL